MVDLLVRPSKLKGDLFIPPSKSHTLRALFFALMAKGKSEIRGYLPSPDTFAMLEAIGLLGARVERKQDVLFIEGVSGNPKAPTGIINCGNSGQILRFIGALAGFIPGCTTLTGDASIEHSRPVKPLVDALNQLGAFAKTSPLEIQGPITRTKASLDGSDSQPVSGLLMAGAFGPHPIELLVENPKETPWIDLTLSWLKKFNIPYEMDRYQRYVIFGQTQITPFSSPVPGDFTPPPSP